ncbi:uncharacterized protein N7459_004491 [Penicillium hispanicum]|uniref:uncharacterized protein n=1 Tax=Penicillium hispanicum TaxID=1080232 RepID=UPI0025410E89|nr:uncharacterized protein N7459_004491 [Penicillium hispanicum]KAJ5584691.1 hypothetical protein N7459_004491 [Penicillium hispanicum]
MGPRGKMLDTDGPTPKFLYAIIKQLDLKIIDWNRVASDLAISNGHAARMRYSRFRNQMEGPLARRPRKKNPKKGEKEGLQVDMSNSTQAPNLSLTGFIPPKLEPVDFSPGSNTFIKCEADVKIPGAQTQPEFPEYHPWPPAWTHTSGSTGATLPPQISSYSSHGVPFTMPSGPSSSHSSASTPHYGPSYPSYSLPYDASMPDFTMQQPVYQNASSESWEPHVSFVQEAAPVKVEIDLETSAIKEENDFLVRVEEFDLD